MKIPQLPPDLNRGRTELIKNIDKFSLAYRLEATDDKGRYLHWDDFRFKPTPEGLNAEEAWVGTKMAREKQMRSTVFKDKNQRAFQFMETDSVRWLLHQIDSNARGRIAMPLRLDERGIGKSFHVASLIEEAFSSSRLEGAATTRERARQIIKEGREPRDKSERMVLNNFQAMEFIGRHKEDPLTIEMILELHRIVTKDTLDRIEMAGVLRGPSDRVVVEDAEGNTLHEPPDAETLKHRLQLLCDFANHHGEQHKDLKIFVHPVIQAIILHFMIGYDHPFVDGNGRTARALFYWQSVKQGYWLIEYASISRIISKMPTQYGRAYLETETDGNDLTYFILHQLTTLDKAIQDLHEHLIKKADELQKLQGRLLAPDQEYNFNQRQIEFLKECVERPGIIMSIEEHRRNYSVSYQTARSDLLELADDGLLEKRKLGKAFVFKSPADLQSRIDTLGAKRTKVASTKPTPKSARKRASAFAHTKRSTF